MNTQKNKVTRKTAVTTKDYTIRFMSYGNITIPKGTTVTNSTAYGNDDNFRFVKATEELAKSLIGENYIMFLHDISNYGINIPEDYCTPYE